MASPRRDLQRSDSFHRSKRTLLLFCSALLITRIPGIELTSGTGLLGVSLKNVNVDLVRWLLWGAAFYYLQVFAFDALSERILNFGAFSVAALADVEKTFAGLRDIAQRSGPVSFSYRLNEVGKLGERISEFATHISGLKHPPEDSTGLIEIHVPTAAPERLPYEKALERIETALHNIAVEQTNLSSEIQAKLTMIDRRSARILEGLTRIALDVTIVRKVQFWVLEVGATVALFLLATYYMPVPRWPL